MTVKTVFWWIWQIVSGLIMLIGLGGIEDDLANWKERFVMLMERGWLSWLFILTGLLMIIIGNWGFLARQAQGFHKHISALLAMTQTDFMVDAQYVITRGLLIIFLPLIVMGVVFNIMAPPIVFLVCGLVFSTGLYVRRLGVTGRHQEQQEVIAILRGLGGLFVTMLVIGVMVVVGLELLDAFKALLHQQVESFRHGS